MFRAAQLVVFGLAGVLFLGITGAHAQDGKSPTPAARRQSAGGVGINLFGGAGVSWPGAKESFETVNLRPNPVDFGGGARLTGLWRGMFLQLSGARWGDTGDRVFIDDAGTAFSLGIPLDVEVTFLDGTLGFERAVGKRRNPYLLYFGGGAGRVQYSESSPFAQAGEDLEVGKISYHALAGLEVPLVKRLAAVVDTRYRYVPDVLGDGGVSAAVGEDSLGGFNASVGLRIGFGGRPHVGSPSGTPGPSKPGSPTGAAAPVLVPTDVQAPASRSSEGTILEAAPAYILPDPTRSSLKTLEPGTRVVVRQEKGDWLQVEFNDTQLGQRVGWVLRRFVRLPGKH